MTHDGRMRRGEEKHAQGKMDSEVQYFLDNKPDEEVIEKPKEVKKSGKSNR